LGADKLTPVLCPGFMFRQIIIDAVINRISGRYDGAGITASENAKYAEHLKIENEYVEVFTKKPVLVIPLQKMSVGFNPTNLFDLGKYGTVYPTMNVRDNWGDLEVTAGSGALMKDWQVVYLSVADKPDTHTQTIEGNGWKLNLADGWKVVADDGNYKVVKE
jgi:hypothetical protein